MPLRRPTPDLLLDLLESCAAGTPPSRRSRRTAAALEALREEGLVDAEGAATPAGLEALERHGRRGTEATVLFTDIVDSTSLIEDHGEETAHAMRRRHFALLSAAIERAGGREVKRLGDGTMAVFRAPDDAIICAADMQRRVAADRDGLGLRIGIHTGEVLRDGADVFGATVVIAARLCARALAGQTVISEAVGAHEHATPLGALRLQGLRRPVTAYALGRG